MVDYAFTDATTREEADLLATVKGLVESMLSG